jgi:DNA-3-methyladenine glycosylase II
MVDYMKQLSSKLYPAPPFSLELTAGYQTYFQGKIGADVFEDGTYRRLIELNERPLLLSVRDIGCVDTPQLKLTVTSEEVTSHDLETASNIIRHILATEINLRPFYDAAVHDPALAPLVKQFYGMHMPRMPSLFEGFIFAISGQQIASSVARLIRTLIVDRYGQSMSLDGRIYRSFPSPKRLLEAGVDGLLGVKLSRRKAEYILGIASKSAQGELDVDTLETMSNDAIIERFDALSGVGRWTAEWVLLRALGRTDVFPAGDLALRRIISDCYFDGRELSEDEARSFAERWTPFKTWATSYLFAGWRLSQKNKKTGKQ